MSLKKNVYAHVTTTLMKVWNILTPPSSFLPLCSWFPVPCPEAATQVPSVKDSCFAFERVSHKWNPPCAPFCGGLLPEHVSEMQPLCCLS